MTLTNAFLPSAAITSKARRSISPCSYTCSATTTITRRMPILYTPNFLKHRPPVGRAHPECPQRLQVCVDALKNSDEISHLLDWTTPNALDGNREQVLEAVRAVHTFGDYLDDLERISKRGGGMLDEDTYVSPDSFHIALLAASTWMQAVDLVKDTRAAWALVRPPGHHALPATGMGFCLLSNAAIAAKYALESGCDNVAILDFDVHHGNGTERCVGGSERIRYASSHQWPLFPNSGVEGTGKSNVLNLNLEEGAGFDAYEERFAQEMLPFLLEDEPDLVIVSAGFDALATDPLAQLQFLPADYRKITKLLMKAVGEQTKLVFGLEGGYHLGEDGLGDAVRECIAGYCIA